MATPTAPHVVSDRPPPPAHEDVQPTPSSARFVAEAEARIRFYSALTVLITSATLPLASILTAAAKLIEKEANEL